MSITAIVAAVTVMATCEWAAPRGTYRVDVEPASLVSNYREIPPEDQHVLQQKMRALAYDDIVLIRKDSLAALSDAQYSDFRAMHFGSQGKKMCAQLTRRTWTPADEERALVYCSRDWCVAVPTVCNNVSLITRSTPPEPGPALLIPPIEFPPVDIPFELPPEPMPGMELPPQLPPVEDRYVDWSDPVPLLPPSGRTLPPSWYDGPFWFGYDLTPLPVAWRPLLPRAPQAEPVDVADKAVAAVQPVPEASTIVYMLIGTAMVALFRKRFI